MKFLPPSLARYLSDYGMVVVLLVLCAFFSVVTMIEQFPVGQEAAQQVARLVAGQSRAAGRVLIATRQQPEDIAFAEALRTQLTSAGFTVVGDVRGDARDAREVLERLASSGTALDAVACTAAAANWLVFADLTKDFPALGTPRLIHPYGYRWPVFLKRENLLNITNQIAVIAIVAVGMTLVIITGGIDLSVGSLIALAAVAGCLLIREAGGALQAGVAAMSLSCLAAIAACGLVGAMTGLCITQGRIPPFIVTLAVMMMASGVAYLLTNGESVYQVPDAFVWLGRGADLFGIPNAVVLMALLYLVTHLLMSKTILGRYIYAVGGNAEAARLSGVPVKRIQFLAYAASGILAGLGGIVMASQLKSGSPTYGQMYELYVIAAVVVGGTSLSGGEGKILGTLIGAFIIAVIQNGMNLMNVESYTQKVVLGFIILAAVLLDKLKQAAWAGRRD